MNTRRNRANFGKPGRRGTTILRGVLAVVLVAAAGVAVWWTVGRAQETRKTRNEVRTLWNKDDYQAAYTLTRQKLAANPLDYELLCINGFSAFQLGLAQITDSAKAGYIDQAIWSLRKALLCKEKYYTTGINYILGKAYYSKGTGYQDETLQYLLAAQNAYQVNGTAEPADLSEYLGLAYAAVHDYRSSVAAFSKALDKESAQDADRLYMAIAQSYQALKEDDKACQYLLLCVSTTADANTKVKARLRLGSIYQADGKKDLAEAQYNAIISETGNNAEAYYQLGKIYAASGDTVKARYEWRRALAADPAHAGARAALGLA